MKKFFTLFLAIVASTCMVFADIWWDHIKIGDLYYILDEKNNSAVVTFSMYGHDLGYSYQGALTIPSIITHEGINYTVVGISNFAFDESADLTHVIIPSTVTYIENAAFKNCPNIVSVTIPESVTLIGSGAFSGCSHLTSINLPDGLTTIESNTFYNCNSLTTIQIPKSVTTIGREAFYNCCNLNSINIPDHVTNIENNAFYNCTGLNSVYITDIASWCQIQFEVEYTYNPTYSNPLYYAQNLYLNDVLVTDLVIPDEITHILHSTFYNCKSLISLVIPNNVVDIGKFAFTGCANLTKVVLNSDLIINKTYEPSSSISSIFGKQVKEFIIGDEVKRIGDNAFYECDSLISVRFSNTLNNIGNEAFSKCPNLTSVTIPNSVTHIEKGAFSYCLRLASITIGNSVDSIGDSAFQGCDSLSSVFIPSNVVYLGKGAFSNSTKVTLQSNQIVSFDYNQNYNLKNLLGFNVKEYIIGEGVTRIGNYAFYANDSLQTILVPNSLTSIGEGAFRDCHNLQSVNIPTSVSSIGKQAFTSCRGLTSILIPDKITDIKMQTFCGCEKLTSIKIPDNVVSIGEQSFITCIGLTSITIGSRVSIIDRYAFANCTSLDTIYNNAPIPQVINSNVFSSVDISKVHLRVPKESVELYKAAEVWKEFIIEDCEPMHGMCGDDLQWSLSCDSMNLIIQGVGQMYNYESGTAPWYDCRDVIQTVSLPSNLTYIGSYAFADCIRLLNINIPNTVTAMGQEAFSNCTGLESIICFAENPPVCGNKAFHNVDKTIPLHVLKASIDAYKIADQWKDFFHDEYHWCITAYGMCGDELGWTISCDTTELQISGRGIMYDYSWNTSPWYKFRQSLKKIYLPKNLINIGDYAFYGCSVNDTIIIPDGVSSIGSGAFMSCPMRSCKIGNNVKIIGSDAFYGCNAIKSIDIPASVVSIAEGALPSGSLTAVNVAANNQNYCSQDGILYNKSKSLLYCYPSAKPELSCTIPDGVYRIGNGAFRGCKNLREIIVKNSVQNIGHSAFAYCNHLTSVTCYATTPPSMGNYVFNGVDCSQIPLFVPAESIEAYGKADEWKMFTDIRAIEAEKVIIEDQPQATPDEYSVVIEWPEVANAEIYTITVTKGEDTICSLSFSKQGQLLSISYAPERRGSSSRKGALQTTNGWQYTITGLESGTEYKYTVIALDAGGQKVYGQTIPFKTTGVATSLDQTSHQPTANSQKLIKDGHLLILRGSHTYTLTGQEVR